MADLGGKGLIRNYVQLLCFFSWSFSSLTGAVVLLFISSGVTMAVPFCVGKIIDIIYTDGQSNLQMMEKLNGFSKILCGVFLLGGLANVARVYLIYTSGL